MNEKEDQNIDVIDYHKDIINRTIVSSDANESLPEREFYSIATELLSEDGRLDNVSEGDSFHHYNPNRGTKIDGWCWNELEKTIYGIVVEFNNDQSKIKTINKTKIEQLGTQVARLFKNIEKESFIDSLSYDEAANLDEIKDSISKTIKFRIIVLTNCEISSSVKKTGIRLEKIYDKETKIEVWSLSDLMELEHGSLDGSSTLINFEEMFGKGLIALSANAERLDQQSYLCVLPAQYLSDLYHEYGQRLLQSNVRSFLEFRGLSNKGMRETLLKEPENFFTYNNGITVTASSHQKKIDGNQLYITELENMQIVNGGQTTAVIYFSPKEQGGPRSVDGNFKWSDIDLSKVSVQMKLTILEDEEEAPMKTAKISQYSNAQAAVSKADLVSNHPFHLRIEQMSRRISVEGSDGIGVEGIRTKWFYERSRGQYTVQLRQRKTIARKNLFKGEYPPKQKFVKADMAKYENTWRMNPDQVSMGAQKNLEILGKELSKEWNKNDDLFRETFFQNLIAKAILFKTIDSEINKSEWYKEKRGYKANAVTYTISLMRHLIQKEGKEINLKRIYDNQKLSDQLLTESLKLARYVRDLLMDDNFRDGNANISQFAKSQVAWHKVRELEYPLNLRKEDLLNRQQQQELTDETDELVVAGSHIDAVKNVLDISKNEWTALYDYLQNDKGLPMNHKDVNIVKTCIDLHQGTKVPSDKQAKLALLIRDQANSENFSFFE
jgi:hypothetical protein